MTQNKEVVFVATIAALWQIVTFYCYYNCYYKLQPDIVDCIYPVIYHSLHHQLKQVNLEHGH